MTIDETKIAIRDHKNWLRQQPTEVLYKSYKDPQFRKDFLFEDPFLKQLTFDSKTTNIQKAVRASHVELLREIFSETMVLHFIKNAHPQSFFVKYPKLQNIFAKIAARQTYLIQNYGGYLKRTTMSQKLYWLYQTEQNDERTKELWASVKEGHNYLSYMLKEYHGYLFIYYQ